MFKRSTLIYLFVRLATCRTRVTIHKKDVLSTVRLGFEKSGASEKSPGGVRCIRGHRAGVLAQKKKNPPRACSTENGEK